MLAVLGFLCTDESNQDIQLVVSSVGSAISYAPAYKGTMATSLTRTQAASLSSLDASNINSRLVLRALALNRDMDSFVNLMQLDGVLEDLN